MRTLAILLIGVALGPAVVAQQVVWERASGPYGGSTTGLAALPAAIVAANGGELFRSSDGGSWWDRVYTSPGLQMLAVVASPDGAAYAMAQTGEILRSLDGGQTWEQFDQGLPISATYAPALAAGPSNELYAGTSVGLYRRLPGQPQWTPTALGGVIQAVAVGPTGTVLASNDEPVGWDFYIVRRSTNGGDTWTNHVLRLDAYAAVRALVFLPDGTALAGGTDLPKGYVDPGLYRSTTDGQTWHVVPGHEDTAVERLSAASGSEGPLALATSRTHNTGLRSTDSGLTWDELPFRIHGAAAAPDASVLVATNYLGVLRTVDSGATWSDATDGLGLADVGRVSRAGDGTIYGACQPDYGPCAGAFRSDDGGSTWTRLAIGSPTGPIAAGTLSLLADHEGRVFAAPERCGNCIQPELWRSLDRGATWTDITPANAGMERFSWLGEDASGTIYACTPIAYYVTTDGGSTWNRRPARGCGSRQRFAVTPAGLLFRTTGSGLGRSTDGAVSWEPVDGPEGYFEVVSATADGSVYAAGEVGVGQAVRHIVYASHDGGVTWSSGEIPLEEPYHRVLDLEEGPNGLVFAATSDPRSVYQSFDGGATWTIAPGDLPAGYVAYADFAYDNAGRLLVGLGDRGMHRTSVPVDTDPDPADERSLARAWPNPARNVVHFVLNLPSPERVRVTLHDMLGRQLAVIREGPMQAGAHALTLDTAPYPPAVYTIRSVGDGGMLTHRLTVAR